jgi:hypothetical protein
MPRCPNAENRPDVIHAGQKVTLSVGIIFVLLGGVITGATAANAQDSYSRGFYNGYNGSFPRGNHPSMSTEYGRGFHAGRSEAEEDADEDDQVMMGKEPWQSSDGPSFERRGGDMPGD